MTNHADVVDKVNEIFITWDEMLVLILKDKGIHEGFYEPNVNFEVGSLSNVNAPNIAFVINKIGLNQVDEEKGAIDASKVNPRPKRTSKKTQV